MTSEHDEIAQDTNATADEPERLSSEEMLGQLQVMARQIAGDAPPSLREASAVAAELTAVAARGSGPIAKTLGELTNDASLRLADRLETYAASVREADAKDDETDDGRAEDDVDKKTSEPSDAVVPDADPGDPA